MNIQKESFKTENSIHEDITGDVRFTDVFVKTMPVVIAVHGFKGFKDWGFFPYLCESIASWGAIVVSFNFSLNGMGDSDDLVIYPEKFSRNTVHQELEDLELVFHGIETGSLFSNKLIFDNWNGEIYLIGHSMGGGVSLLAAAKNKIVKKLVLLASISKFDRYTPHQKELWRQKSFAEVTNSRTGQVLKMDIDYLNDVEQHHEAYNLEKAISGLRIPVLIVHGTVDLTVLLREAETLANATTTEFLSVEYIPQTGHTFGSVHPFEGTNPALEKAIKSILLFFNLQ